jgi:hypothetical protein
VVSGQYAKGQWQSGAKAHDLYFVRIEARRGNVATPMPLEQASEKLAGLARKPAMAAPFIVAVPKDYPLAPGTVGRTALDMVATVTECVPSHSPHLRFRARWHGPAFARAAPSSACAFSLSEPSLGARCGRRAASASRS